MVLVEKAVEDPALVYLKEPADLAAYRHAFESINRHAIPIETFQ